MPGPSEQHRRRAVLITQLFSDHLDRSPALDGFAAALFQDGDIFNSAIPKMLCSLRTMSRMVHDNMRALTLPDVVLITAFAYVITPDDDQAEEGQSCPEFEDDDGREDLEEIFVDVISGIHDIRILNSISVLNGVILETLDDYRKQCIEERVLIANKADLEKIHMIRNAGVMSNERMCQLINERNTWDVQIEACDVVWARVHTMMQYMQDRFIEVIDDINPTIDAAQIADLSLV